MPFPPFPDDRPMPPRERLVAIIRARPGIHKSALCAAVGLAWGTVDYHLRVLARDGRIEVWPAGRETRCFPGDLEPPQRALLAALADGCASRVAWMLRRFPGRGVGELSQRLGLSSKVVRRRLLRMVEDGMVRREGFHRPRYSFGLHAAGLLEALEGQMPPADAEAWAPDPSGRPIPPAFPGPAEPVAVAAAPAPLAGSKTGK